MAAFALCRPASALVANAPAPEPGTAGRSYCLLITAHAPVFLAP